MSAGGSNWYSMNPTGTVTFHLLPFVGDTDLYVYSQTSPCNLVDSSARGGLSEDTVTVGAGSYYIEARYSSAVGFSEYLFRVT